MKVEFYKHNLDEDDIARMVEVCRGVFLTTGQQTREFEEAFAAYLGAQHAVGLTSCTAALHLALLALDVGPGDEVITTPMTFAATSNTIIYTGARPVFVDVEPATGLIDPEAVARAITKETKAIIAVHLYGLMADMRRLKAVTDAAGVALVEDCAHAIESARDGVRPGELSQASCFSFYATKNITCGEGGALVTNDERIANRVRTLRSHGMSANAADRYTSSYRHWDLETLGWKYNMTNIQAAMLMGQLARIDTLWDARERLAQRYEAALSDADGVRFPIIPDGAKSARHLFTIWVAPERRDDVLSELQARGIGVAVNYRSVHLLKYYRDTFGFTRGMFPEAERIGDSTVTLPLYTKLTTEQVDYVAENVKAIAALTPR